MVRKTRKIVGILLLLMMVMQIVPVGVGASGLEVYWGQDYPYDDESPLPCTVMFYHEEGITNYEFTLYKDNQKVFSERIEEGLTDDSWWEEETVFLTEFAENGSGSYHFTVSSLEGDGWDIDEAEIIETKTSGKFIYTQPSSALTAPTVVSNKNGEVTWQGTHNGTAHYIVDTLVEYPDETYDPDYAPVFYWDNSYSFAEVLEETLKWFEENDPERFPFNEATVKIRVRALPEDIRDYQPSGYSDWIIVKKNGSGSSQEPEEEKPVDRSSVSKEYYEAAKIVYDLGIMSWVYDEPEKEVTRGELAVALTAITGMKEMAKGLEDLTIFSDVEKGTELNGCINAVNQSGLLSGTENGVFSPDDEVTYAQICKVLVDALGYGPMAEYKGGFPTGYMYVVSREGIAEGITGLSKDSAVTTEQLAQLLANALETKIMKVEYQFQYGSWQEVYKITDKTLLLNDMGLELYTTHVNFANNNTKAKVSGKYYNDDNLTGTAVSNKTLTVKDLDILNYTNTDMKLYVSNNEILCGLEYYDGEVVLEKGETITTNDSVSLDFEVYGFTKYKMNDGEYKPLPKDTIYWMTDGTDGRKTATFTFATEDESLTQKKTYYITLDNKHTITYLLNGEVYQTQTVGYGKTITAPTVPNLGVRFQGWIGLPKTMPDYDITVSASVLPEQETYTGTLVYNDEPVSNATIFVGNSSQILTDAQGTFSFNTFPRELMLTVYYEGMTQTFFFDGEENELGTLELESAAVNIVGAKPLQWVEGLDALLTDADYAYASMEGNVVSVQLSSGYAPEDTAMDEYRSSNYSDYEEIAEMDITLTKITSGEIEKNVQINETDSSIEISIPIPTEQKGMAEYVVLRKHGDNLESLTATPNADGEYIEVGEDSVTVYAKKFSVYSLIGFRAHRTFYHATVTKNVESVQVDVIFPEEENEKAVLYVAYYGENGKPLKTVTKKDFTETNTFDAVSGTEEMKVFIWDDAMNPLLKK